MATSFDLFKYLANYDAIINNLFDDFLMDLAKCYILPSHFSNISIFSYNKYPKDAKAARTAAEKFRKRLNEAVLSGINGSVLLASKKQKKELGEYSKFSDEVLDSFRKKVAESFIKNRIEPEHGMKLSTRVWNYTEQTKAEFELGLSQILEDGIKEGTSAEELGRKVRDKLKDPDSMWRRYHVKKVRADGTKVDVVEWRKKVIDDDGRVHFVKQPLDHPGRGVYRSARQNALRMTATEINMAYDYSDIMRYQNEPFVLGYHIGLSGHRSDVVKNFHDMCDDLVGDYPKWFMWNGWHPRCYSDDSEVLTSEGWKLFKDIDCDDKILSLNPNSRNVEWVSIERYISYPYKGKMVRFSNKSLDCLVTPNHEMVYLQKETGKISRCLASEYTVGKGGFYRSCEYKAGDVDRMTIGGTEYDFDSFCEFMGYWLADGSIAKHRNCIVVTQQKDDGNCKNIIDCFRRMGLNPYQSKNAIGAYNAALCEYLCQFGHCAEKYVPKEIKDASPKQIRIFLDAFNSCDGTIKKARTFVGNHGNVCNTAKESKLYFTTSAQLSADIGELLLKVGHRPSYYLEKRAGRTQTFKNGEYTINYDCYRITECYASTATVFDKTLVDYDGSVYDVELQKNHIMYIRRNGKCFWGSNCKCILTAILCSEDEMRKIQSLPEEEYLAYKSPNLISSMPQCYNDYIEANKERIAQSIERGTQPYWIRDNYEDGDLSKGWRIVSEPEVKVIEEPQGKISEERRAAIEEARRKRHASRNEEDIQRRWDMRYIERWEYSQKKWETDPNKLSEDYLRANINSMLVCVKGSGYYPEDTLSKMPEWELRYVWKKDVMMANLYLDVCSRNAKVIKDTAKEILKKNSSYPVVSRLRLYMENTNDHDAWNLANRIVANEKGVKNLMELVKRDVDFSVVSPNMPYQLLPDSKDYPMDGRVLDRRLFDSVDYYVPLELDKKGGGFCSEIPIKVHLNPEEGRGKYHNIQVIYHEYGHALDMQNGCKTAEVDALMKDYDKKYKKTYVSIDRTLGLSFVSSSNYFDSKRHKEEVMAEMDVIQALTKGKYGRKDIDGHAEKGYWTGKGHKKRHPHTEFVAHMSEYYFLPNEYAKKADPERYEAMRSLFEKSFIKQRRVFNSAEPVVSAVELRAQKIAEAAAKRHAARTPEKIQQLRDFAKKHKEDWEKTVKFIESMTERSINIDEASTLGRELTKAYINRRNHTVEHLRGLAEQIKGIAVEYDLALMDATDIANELSGISDIDIVSVTTSSSIKGLKEGTAMLQQKKNELLALSYIDNPIEVARTYSFADAVGVNSSIVKKMASIDASVDAFVGTEKQKLEYRRKLIVKEIKYINGDYGVDVKSKYRTWKVSQDAYNKMLVEVDILIDIEMKKENLSVLAAFSTKNAEYNDYVALAQKALDEKNFADYDLYFDKAAKKKADIEKQAAYNAQMLKYWQDAKTKITQLKSSIDPSDTDSLAKLKELEAAYKARRKKDTERILAELNAKLGIVGGRVVFGKECFTQARKDAASWHANANDANNEYFDEAVEFVKQLNDDERQAFDGYTGGSAYITETLRSIPDHYYYYEDHYDGSLHDINAMTDALNRVAIKKDRWVKRDAGAWDFEYMFGMNTGDLMAKQSVYVQVEQYERTIKEYEDMLSIFESIQNGESIDYLQLLIANEISMEENDKMNYGSGHDQAEFDHRIQSLKHRKNAIALYRSSSVEEITRISETYKKEITAYRAKITKLQPQMFTEGIIGKDESFMSCGDCRRTWFECTGRKDVVYNIYLPKGSHAVYAHPFSSCGMHGGCDNFEKSNYRNSGHVSNNAENEIIIQRGSSFRLAKIRFDSDLKKWIVDLELIGQDTRDFTMLRDNGLHVEFK